MKKMMSREQLHECISVLNPITPLYNLLLISEGSCSICGKLDHINEKCSMKSWSIQQIVEFYSLKDRSNFQYKYLEDNFSQNDNLNCFENDDYFENLLECVNLDDPNFSLVEQFYDAMMGEIENINCWAMEQFDKTRIVLNLKIELTLLIAIFAKLENLFLEKSIWPNNFGSIKILRYTVPKEWFVVEYEKFGVEYGCEGKTSLDPLEERIFLLFFEYHRIIFLWYRDGYSDHHVDSQATDFK